MRLVHAEETAGLFHNSLLTANGIRHGFQSAPPRCRTLVITNACDIVFAHCALHGRGALGRGLLRNLTEFFRQRQSMQIGSERGLLK
jgi:hypothetical protein